MAENGIGSEYDLGEILPEPTASADLKINLSSGEVEVSTDGSGHLVSRVVESVVVAVGLGTSAFVLGPNFGAEHPLEACLMVATFLSTTVFLSRKA